MPDEVTRKLTRSADYSFYVLLPPEWLKELGWRERQKVVLKKEGEKIILTLERRGKNAKH